MELPEIAEYPDSSKVLAMSGNMATAQGPQDMDIAFIGMKDAAVGYFDGESE